MEFKMEGVRREAYAEDRRDVEVHVRDRYLHIGWVTEAGSSQQVELTRSQALALAGAIHGMALGMRPEG